jgi:hypothetical protein
MVAAFELVEVDATARTRARDLLDGIERHLLIMVAAFCGSLVVFTRLFLMERHLTAKAVASFARSAVEDVAIVFGEEGPLILVSMLSRVLHALLGCFIEVPDRKSASSPLRYLLLMQSIHVLLIGATGC